MRALDDMVRSGKVRYVGASQYPAWRICRCNDLAERYGWVPFVSTQAHYNLLERQVEAELLPFCRAMGVGVLAYFVLANGLLAGRYAPDGPPPADSRAAAFERTRRYLDTYATPAKRMPHPPTIVGLRVSPPGLRSAGTPWPSWPSPGCWPSRPSRRC